MSCRFTNACDEGVRKGALSKNGEKAFSKLAAELDQLAKGGLLSQCFLSTPDPSHIFGFVKVGIKP